MHKYQVGDRVLIKSEERLKLASERNESVGLAERLIKYGGWVANVTEITRTCIRLDLPELPEWYWDADWVIPYKQRSE